MYEELIPYASTENQRETIQACIEAGSARGAARLLGKGKSTVQDIVKLLRERKEQEKTPRQMIGNLDTPIVSPLTIKGTSTLFDAETGEAKITWIKTNKDMEILQKEAEEYIEGLKAEIEPAKPVKRNKIKLNENLLNLYVMTDYHWGMLSWADETGADWDLDIAENMMVDAFTYLIEHSPEAEVGFFCELGDFEHYDSHIAVTPQNKHILDADGRPTKMIRTAIKAQRRIIEMMAKKYKKVIVLNAEGNHNIISSVWKRELFAELYSKDKRIEVITDVLPYYAYQWGKNMLGFHHGHLKAMAGLSDVFVANYREMFGITEAMYIHTGHKHHKHVVEKSTGIIEQHQTLAAPDAYAARGGWISQRSMQTITYHKDFFETGRTIVRPEML